MSMDDVRTSYGARAAEYADRFGKVEALADAHLAAVTRWAQGIEGAVLDVGCGPGQWTQLLSRLGLEVEGIDPVPEFVDLARMAYPRETFRLGRAEDTGVPHSSLGGVLAWYSLIHRAPACIGEALAEFRRILQPGGGLALGFFEGPALTSFDHAVTTAYFWPMNMLVHEVEAAGFTVSHTDQRSDPGTRPHGMITAVQG